MRKILLGLLVVILVLGLFAAIGYAGYRFGYAQGIQAAVNGGNVHPGLRPFDDSGPGAMPMHRFRFERGLGRDGFPGLGFGFLPLWILPGRVAMLGLVIWFIYWLLTRNGWRLTRQTTMTASSKAENE